MSRSGTKLKVRMSQSPSIRALNEKLLPARYAADRKSQQIIALGKKYIRTAVSRLPSLWRQKNSIVFPRRKRFFIHGQPPCYSTRDASNVYVLFTLLTSRTRCPSWHRIPHLVASLGGN